MKYFLSLYLIFLLSFSKVNSQINCSSSCLQCENGICLACPRGLFTFKNGCYEGCPENTLADNFSLSCKKSTRRTNLHQSLY